MCWLSFLITERRVESFMVEPPCTTFSIMRRPPLRGADKPYGYDLQNPQTLTGNTLALRGMQSIALGRRYEVPGLFETPFSSKVKYLPPWQQLLRHHGVSQTRCDSCCFGSPHLKPFKFLGCHVDLSPVSKRCQCKKLGKTHIQVQGKYTKGSATYVPALGDALAEVLSNAILARRLEEIEDEQKVDGLEDQLVNAVMKSSDWTLEATYPVNKDTHINLLEVDAVCKLASRLAYQGGSTKAVALVDSNVTKGATSKGRSSSRALTNYLKRLGSTLVSGDVYLVTPFTPTRLNRADDPTRSTKIRDPESDKFYEDWPIDYVFKLAEVKKLKRWASNWVGLLVRLVWAVNHWMEKQIHLQKAMPLSFSALSGLGFWPHTRLPRWRSSTFQVLLWIFTISFLVDFALLSASSYPALALLSSGPQTASPYHCFDFPQPFACLRHADYCKKSSWQTESSSTIRRSAFVWRTSRYSRHPYIERVFTAEFSGMGSGRTNPLELYDGKHAQQYRRHQRSPDCFW